MAPRDINKSEPLSPERPVETFRLSVRRLDEKKARFVAARAITSANDGQPAIDLGGIEVELVSGGGAIDRVSGQALEIKPETVVLYPEGDKLQRYNIPASEPFDPWH